MYFEYLRNSFLVAVKTTPLKFGLSLKTRSRISKGFALPHTNYLLALQNGTGNVSSCGC